MKKFIFLSLIGLISCNQNENTEVKTAPKKEVEIKDTVAIEMDKEIKESAPKIVQNDFLKYFSSYQANELSMAMQMMSISMNDKDFATNYRVLRRVISRLKLTCDFETYYKDVVNDGILNDQLFAIEFGCKGECMEFDVALNHETLKTLAKETEGTTDDHFIEVLIKAYGKTSNVEMHYPKFSEKCDECFGAISNIGNNRVKEFLLLAEKENKTFEKEIATIKNQAFEILLEKDYRYNKEEVLEELISLKHIELVKNRIDSIQNNPELFKFNYVAEGYPEIDN